MAATYLGIHAQIDQSDRSWEGLALSRESTMEDTLVTNIEGLVRSRHFVCLEVLEY